MDRLVYLRLLCNQARLEELPIWAYCLLGNPIHLIAVPDEGAQLSEVMQRVHGRYAQYFNTRRARCGHLWQNRFNSCALGPAHLWTALGFVERSIQSAPVACRRPRTTKGRAPVRSWPARIRNAYWTSTFGVARARYRIVHNCSIELEQEPECRALRRATYSDQPFGDEKFVDWLPALRSQLAHPGERRSIIAGRHEIAIAACGANR
jgi:REP element-mobilizing transposase RayT